MNAPSGTNTNLWAQKARKRLLTELGGKCVVCGATERLHIDHIHGKDWIANKHSQGHRLSIYRREAKQGLLQILCKFHNESKPKKRRVTVAEPF